MMDVNIDEMLTEASCWILSDGKAGHLNQSIGVAEALGIENYDIIELEKAPFGSVLKYVHPALAVKKAPIDNFPDIVIGAGNLTALISKYIKVNSPTTFTIQMMKPTGSTKLFNVIAAPMHDRMKQKDNVITTIGAPNRITKEKLETELVSWNKEFSKFKGPVTAAFIGGAVKQFSFTEKEAKELAEALVKKVQKEEGSLLVSTSRRTSDSAVSVFENVLNNNNLECYFYNPKNDKQTKNPYFAMMAKADDIVVTAESVSMVSESCSANKPVYVYGLGQSSLGKFDILLNALRTRGLIESFPVKAKLKQPQEPLNDTLSVAGFARSKYMQHVLMFSDLEK